MRKEYTPSTPLNPTYVGPYRIMELFPQGALLKDPRTGEQMSVHFANYPGWVAHLCTFALWQQLSIVLVNRHFFLNQSQNENEIRTFDRPTGIA